MIQSRRKTAMTHDEIKRFRSVLFSPVTKENKRRMEQECRELIKMGKEIDAANGGKNPILGY